MLNIVIPMVGHGQRFKDAGYELPKPLIDVEGVPMFIRVIDNIIDSMQNRYEQYQIVLIVNNQGWYTEDKTHELFTEAAEKLFIERGCPEGLVSLQICDIDGMTEGAACTVLKAEEYIDNEYPLIIANCDQLVSDLEYITNGLDYFESHNGNAGIWCFLADSPKWSYAQITQGTVRYVKEKEVISPFATVGLYYFQHGRDFVQAANDMIRKNIRVNGEFYVCPVFNELIINKAKVLPYIINEMHGLGTPEDLEIYLNGK